MGLDYSIFSTVPYQILSMDLLPYVSQAYSIIIREESHHMMVFNKEERDNAIAFAARPLEKSYIVGHVCNETRHSAT